jgi:hypothetical protein
MLRNKPTPRAIQCLSLIYDKRIQLQEPHHWHGELRKLKAVGAIDDNLQITPVGIKLLESWNFPVSTEKL